MGTPDALCRWAPAQESAVRGGMACLSDENHYGLMANFSCI